MTRPFTSHRLLPSFNCGQVILRLAHFASVLLLAVILVGCNKNGASASSAPLDPEMEARLAQMTHDLHRAMVGRILERDFDKYAALNKLEVPPPPPGKKYVINEKWRVVLQDK